MQTNTKRDDYIRASLALSLIPEIGANRIKNLFEHFESPMSLFSRDLPDLVRVRKIGASVARSIRSFQDWGRVDQLMSMAEKHEVTLLTLFDDTYPCRLKQIHDPPALLWVRGDPAVLKRCFLAIVGTRRPSVEGREATIKLTRELIATTDLAIVSGLAHGVDTIAHRVILEENGCTVAVLGCGIDRIYPTGNFRLAQRMLQQGGAIISEFPPGTRPEAHNFPIRNRVVSGMSLGVLVTETGMAGGSRITAGKALDQNREVFIVPHAISNKKGTGSNDLIKNSGGKLVTCVDDILVEFPYTEIPRRGATNVSGERYAEDGQTPIRLRTSGPVEKSNTKDLSNLEKRICRLLSKSPIHADRLSQKLQMRAENLLPVLLKLELADVIIQKPGKKFTLKS